MDDTIAGGDDGPGIGDFDVRVFLQDLVDSFADDADVPFDGTAEHQIPGVFVEATGNLIKERLDLVNGGADIVQVGFKMPVVHRFFAWSRRVLL